MINIPHVDLKIWNPEQKAIEIIAELQKHGRVQIEIDREGSDCKTNGLYKLLDNICSTLGYDPATISIHTCNQLEQHSQYKIVKHPPLYISSGQQFAKHHTYDNKNWNFLKHFGIFISRSSWQRLWIASHLWNNFKNQTLITFHYDSKVDYHRLHLGFDELCYNIGSHRAVDTAANFLKELPIKNDNVDSYPILTPEHFAISKLYPDFFVEIVCETFLSGRSFYPTEKIWRPFICQTPFLMLGPRDFLSNLRKLGFRTFNQWWDESYDQDADIDNGRVAIQSILSTVHQLSLLTVEDLEGLYIDMFPILQHNKQRFLDLKESEFLKLWP
jgi:hypothetical protein